MKEVKKTVLLIHKGYPLGVDAGDKMRTLNMAVSLMNIGYNVVLLGFITCRFSQIQAEKRSLPSGLRSLFIFTLPNRLGLIRMAAFLRAAATYVVCKAYSVDSIQAELSTSVSCVRFVKHIPLVTDFHSDVVPELEMAGSSRIEIRSAISENKYALTHSVGIITVSDNLYRNLHVYGASAAVHDILPCNFIAEPFMQTDRKVRQEMRERYNVANRIVLCYSGGLHVWQCIRETLELVIRLRQVNPRYYFCLFTRDDITPYQGLLDQLDGHCLIIGLDWSDIPAYLSMIDAGLVLRQDSLVNLNASPTKTSEYLAAGAMAVVTRYAGDAPVLVRESSCGVILDEVRPTDEEVSMLDDQLVAYEAAYDARSQQAKDYVFQNRVWASNEDRLRTLYDDIYCLLPK